MARVSLEEPRRPRRPALLALGVLLALGLVALASRAHAPTGGGGPSHVSGELLFEYVVLFFLALALVVAPFMAHAFWTARRHEPMRKRSNWMLRTFVTIVLLAVALTGIATWRAHLRGDSGSGAGGTRTETTKTTAVGSRRAAQHVRFDWVPVIVVGSLVLTGALIAVGVLRGQRNARSRSPEALAAELSDVLDDTLDDLRAESDPRRAVIAAYARMERSLAWFGLPRRVFEAPLEYLARVLAELHASAESVTRLTALFERAKFSPHEIGAPLKEDAIGALVAVRDELRSYR
jgi:uncharacterized protein DUF4129